MNTPCVCCGASSAHGLMVRAECPQAKVEQGANVIVVCLDMEGVLTPEIWVEFASQVGIEELTLTTRDEPDYDKLMQRRILLLERHGVRLADIQRVIERLGPLPGAREFLSELRARYQAVILSDTYYEFALPIMRQLDWPTLFCHRLETDAAGRVVGYRLRMRDQKRAAVAALRGLNFGTIAVGDSYNDISMLQEAQAGILFRPPVEIARQFPQFPVVSNYSELAAAIGEAAAHI
jgi:phosphoserine / homoserine phosphotransferase